MKRTLTRIIGIALIVAAIAGLIFSMVGLVVLGRTQQVIETSLTENLQLLDQALTATAEGLTLAETSLTQATATIQSLAQTASSAGRAISGTVPTVDAVSELLGEQLPATIVTVQETLSGAAQTAKAVDDMLAVITAIPLLGTDRYNPDVPLNAGLDEVAASLDGIPDSLTKAQEGLDSVKGDLQGVGDDFATMAESIGELAVSVSSAQGVLAQYQEVVANLQGLVASVQQGLPGWLRVVRLALSLVLIWLGIAQIGLMTQGWELIGRSRVTDGERRQAQADAD